jgi:hypothetical protein
MTTVGLALDLAEQILRYREDLTFRTVMILGQRLNDVPFFP